MLNTRGAVDAGRRKETPVVEDRGGSSCGEGRGQLTPAVEDRGERSYGRGPQAGVGRSEGPRWELIWSGP